jgi:hypothetical protein
MADQDRSDLVIAHWNIAATTLNCPPAGTTGKRCCGTSTIQKEHYLLIGGKGLTNVIA